MKKFIVLIFVFMFLLSISFGIEPPAKIYSIQVGAYPSTDEAQSQKTLLEKAGYSPVTIVNVDNLYKVRFGEFDYYVDALLYKKDLRNSLVPDAFLVPYQNTENKTLENTKGPITKIFNVSEDNISKVPDKLLNENDPLIIEIRALINSSDKEALRKKLTDAINTLSDNDVRKGFVLTQKGILEEGEKNFQDALECFLKVANGKVTATKADRMESMRRVGRVYHQKVDRVSAYKAYREMEAFSADDINCATARVECAGLLMELARSEAGKLSECRRECEKIVESTSKDFEIQLALAELMHLETWYYEGNSQKCIEEAEAYLSQYSDNCNREKAMCKTFLGICHHKNGDYEKAVEVLSSIMDMEITREWRVVGSVKLDSKKDALNFLINIAKERNDTERLTQWETLKQQLYGQ